MTNTKTVVEAEHRTTVLFQITLDMKWAKALDAIQILGLERVRDDFELDTRGFKLTNMYFASKEGYVYKLKNTEIVKCHNIKDGNYQNISVQTTEGNKCIRVQHLIYSAFNDAKIKKGYAIHHLDGHKVNEGNRLENLQMITKGENVRRYFSDVDGETAKYFQMQQYQEGYDSDIEQWKTNPETELVVSNFGRIKGHRNKILTTTLANKKYPNDLIVGFTTKTKNSSISLQKLVAETWLVIGFSDYKTLIVDDTKPVSERYKASNLYTVPTHKAMKEAK